MARAIGGRAAGTALVLGAALAVAAAQPAGAYTPPVNASCATPGFSEPGVRIVVHVGGSSLDAAGVAGLLRAIADVNEEFNRAGATSARVAAPTATGEPFDHDGRHWRADPEPTIHLGFVAGLADRAIAQTSRPAGGSMCTYSEADIGFLDPDAAAPWDFGEPDRFFTAGARGAGTTYFRPVYLHELLHAFGLEHSPGAYSFMNYGDRPWANRPAGQRIRPLPDDVRVLRERYPAAGNRVDVAVLNTWFDDGRVSNRAATGRPLCLPGRGGHFGASVFDASCGSAPEDPAGVCAGAGTGVPDDDARTISPRRTRTDS